MFMLKLLFIIIKVILSLHAGHTQTDIPYELQQLQKNSPVVFEAVGAARFYSDTWTVFTKFVPMDYGVVIQTMKEGVTALETICNNVPDDDFHRHCYLTSRETMKNILNLEKTLNQMQGLTRSKRPKRALEFIGGFSKWAFGTMDSEDARKVYHQLEFLHKRDMESLQLMHKQLSVMSSNYNTLSKPITELTGEIEAVAAGAKNLSEAFLSYAKNTNNEIAVLKLRSDFNTLISGMTAKIMEVQNQQAMELSIIDDLYQGRLHPFILDEGNITGLLNNITTKGRFSFENPVIIHQAAKTSVYFVGEKLLIKVTLPLPEYLRYKIQKIYPLPSPLDEHWDLVLDTKHEYIAESEDHDRFVILNEREYSECTFVATGGSSTSTAVCRHEKPILTSGSNECLIELLQHVASSKDSCKYAVIPATEAIFLKMTSSNEWLFKVRETMSLNLKCDSQNYAVTLNSSGILKMLQRCEASAKGFKLFYEFHAETSAVYKQPMVDHSELRETLLFKFNITKPEPIPRLRQIKVGNHKNLANILNEGKKNIDDLAQSWNVLEAERKISNQDWELAIHRYSMMFIITLGAAVVVLVFLVRRFRKRSPAISSKHELNSDTNAIEMPRFTPKRRAPSTPNVTTNNTSETVFGITSARV